MYMYMPDLYVEALLTNHSCSCILTCRKVNINVDISLQTVVETPVVPPTPDKDTSRELLSEKLEDDEPDGIFTFKRKPHVKYHHVSLVPCTC